MDYKICFHIDTEYKVRPVLIFDDEINGLLSELNIELIDVKSISSLISQLESCIIERSYPSNESEKFYNTIVISTNRAEIDVHGLNIEIRDFIFDETPVYHIETTRLIALLKEYANLLKRITKQQLLVEIELAIKFIKKSPKKFLSEYGFNYKGEEDFGIIVQKKITDIQELNIVKFMNSLIIDDNF